MSTIFARLQVAVENKDIPGQQLMMYERGQLWDAMAGAEYCSSLIRSYLVNMRLTPESVGLIVTDEDRRRAFAHDRTRSIAEEVDAGLSVQPTTSPNPDGFLNDSMELAPNYDADHDSNPGIRRLVRTMITAISTKSRHQHRLLREKNTKLNKSRSTRLRWPKSPRRTCKTTKPKSFTRGLRQHELRRATRRKS
jgi:hypothetical protein